MSGFGSVGEWAIGEDETDGVFVQVSTLEAVAESYVPAIGGAEIRPGVAIAEATAFAPRVVVGVVTAPETAEAVAIATPPMSSAGTSVQLSCLEAEASEFSPVAEAGASALPPTSSAAAQATVPMVGAGASARPNVRSAIAACFAPSIVTAGVIVEPVDARIYVQSGGSIGEGAIGEFAIGEGEDAVQVTRTHLRAFAVVSNPTVSAGAAGQPTSLQAVASKFNPEAHARRRRIAMHAIAS